MRERIALTFNQREIMSEFYSLPSRKVLLGKAQRNGIWNAIRNGRNPIPGLDGFRQSCPALYHQIVQHVEMGGNIQSAVFSECVYAQALADIFRLTVFRNCLVDATFLPPQVVRLLSSYALRPRYAYMTPDGRRMLIQAGGCGGVDSALITVFDLKIFTIEFKEPGAKTSEPDLPKYGEDGELRVTGAFLAQYPQFGSMLREKAGLNFFRVMGSNVHDFSAGSVNEAIVENYCAKKFADVVCTEDVRQTLVMIPVNQVSLWAKTEGEIRPSGRNHYAVWTPLALRRMLQEKGASVIDGRVSIPVSSLVAAQPRGGRGISRYKINPLFFVRAENVSVTDGRAVFPLDAVRQLNPTIAGKMFFEGLSYSEIKAHYFGG